MVRPRLFLAKRKYYRLYYMLCQQHISEDNSYQSLQVFSLKKKKGAEYYCSQKHDVSVLVLLDSYTLA